MRKLSLGAFILSILLVITTLFSIGYSSFVIAGSETTKENITISTTEDRAVCYTQSDNVYYTSIEKGISVANSRSGGDTVVVKLGVTTSIKENITIKNGTTLLIAHSADLSPYTFSASGTATRISLVSLINGADINVEYGGKLILGGTFGTSGMKGNYSQIALGKDSSITISGTAQLYGYITEVNPIYGNKSSANIVYNNSLDENRFINVTSTGFVESIFCAYDMGSGNSILNKVQNNICPTYKFDFRNIQTYLKVDKGGQIKVMAYVEISGQSKNALCGLIGSSDDTSTNYLFYVEDGYIGIEYCSSSKTLIYVSGSSNIGSLYIDVNVAQIDSKKFDLPISSIFDIYINGTFNTNSKCIKFLPGSNFTIGEGSTLNVHGIGTGAQQKSKIYIYEANTMIAIGIANYGSKDCNFVNNGTINVNEYGAIAGYISTNNELGSSIVNLSSVSDASNLALSTKEGTKAELDTPLLEFKGPFYDASNSPTYISNSMFEAGNIYYSHSGAACYDGNINKLQKVTININKTNYKHNAYEYTLYTNDTASDTGATLKYEGVNNIASNILEVSNDSYIKINDSKCEYITINGQSYTIGSWYKITSETLIQIQPKEAFVITCDHTTGKSGAGSIKRSITYGQNSSSMTLSESTETGAKITATMPKGWVFKVSDNASVSGTSQVIKTTYDENGTATSEVIATKSGGIAWSSNTIYTADADYRFTSDNVTCIVEGSNILMHDNTLKKVENLQIGDLVKVFNHETGKIDISPIIFITHKDEEALECTTIELCFEKNIKIKIANDHALFDKTTNRYEIINEQNYINYINHEFVVNNNENMETIKLKSANIRIEKVRVYCPVSAYHMNLFANGLLTMPTFPYDIQGLYNIFDLDENMKYDEERMNIDINTYGLFTYEEFIKIIEIPLEAFYVSPAIYLKVSLGKGLITEEQIILGIKYLLNNDLIDSDK